MTPSAPLFQKGEIVLADNFAAVWFVFTNLWYDVGRIYNLENVWTGTYCDIMEPVKRDVDANGQLRGFEITDLFLDLWINPDGSYAIQDEDEFTAAVASGAIGPDLAAEALGALESLIAAVEAGDLERRVAAAMQRLPAPDLQTYIKTLA